MPGSLQSTGRRVGRTTAGRSVGGMTRGEEAAVVGECSLPKTDLGVFFEGNVGTILLTGYTEKDLTAYSQSLNELH